MYTYYTWELLIFLVIKVCGFNSAYIYSMVIPSWSDIEIWATSNLSLKKLMELPTNSNYLLSSVVVTL